MRLINVETRMFEEFVGANIPLYAILSHTWGAEEVTFPQYANPESRLLRGYEKIEQSCRLAAERAIGYVWVDTCCIDKSSSAELSEAINSMYNWYKSAKFCFVYLFDFEAYEKYEGHYQDLETAYESDPALRSFSRCKWFTRGWTLQEMLAPNAVEFFDANWKFFGEKHDMISLLTFVTKIASEFFWNPRTASVAQKFSWAAHRETTRVEDIAYCLLGLFDINMPLLYGEGVKAFKRLQLEILSSSEDESIFAWSDNSIWASGMLAASPSNFVDSGKIVPLQDPRLYRSPYQMTHQGLQIEFVSFVSFAGQNRTGRPFEVYLRCCDNDNEHEPPENLVALLIEPYETLPRMSRARRVLPAKLEYRKYSDIIRTFQERGNHPVSTEKSQFLIKELRRLKETDQVVEKSYPISKTTLKAKNQGKCFLQISHDRAIKSYEVDRQHDGRHYIGVTCEFHEYQLHYVIIRLPRPACKLAQLELFFPPSDLGQGPNERQIYYHESLNQIQTGRLQPSLMSKGDHIVRRVAPRIDLFIALRPTSTIYAPRFELEMQLAFI